MIEIRSDPDDPNSEVVDRLARRVEPFSMGRFPVTIAQFQAFLTHCYRDGRLHLPPGFPVQDDYRSPKHRARHGNHPADTVNSYDALAFCHWLGSELGKDICLPTEFQWQRAATGGEPLRIYPWGGEWDPEREPWRANTYESGLARATAVGMYPLGASKAGIEDMAGTLWEWCANAFENPDNTEIPTTERDYRVVRGGCWSDSLGDARCVYRYRYNPFGRNDGLGFRVVCSSPIASPSSLRGPAKAPPPV